MQHGSCNQSRGAFRPASSGQLRPTLMESIERLELEIERSNALLRQSVNLTERSHSAIDLYWRRFHDRRSVAANVESPSTKQAAPRSAIHSVWPGQDPPFESTLLRTTPAAWLVTSRRAAHRSSPVGTELRLILPRGG